MLWEDNLATFVAENKNSYVNNVLVELRQSGLKYDLIIDDKNHHENTPI